ncbi:alpha/beta hydrolase [Thermoanaerobacterium thermosaccharolyticum]|uniref:alpha/beta fold hydrolase n=1 Tax=Thermoanaerobacterium thermosaccharolyticum TaxID=1517 RepID=UPI003DA9285C
MAIDDDKYIDIGGAKIHYLISGDGEKDTVLLLHGKKFTADDWRNAGIVDYINNEGYKVVAVEVPGYGKSEMLDIPYEEFIKKFADDLNLDKFHIVGPSFSGEISIKFALKYQDMLKSLVIIDSINVDKYKERLKEIKVKTLIVWGKKDDVAPYEFAMMLKENIPDAKIYTFEELGHTCYLKEPKVFSKELIDFLSGK